MRVALYLRVSTNKKKKTEINSYDEIRVQQTRNQRIDLENYCNLHNHDIVNVYEERISGVKAKRPEFEKMMDDAKNKKFDILLFWSLDRFSRAGVAQTLEHLTTLKKYGVEFVSLQEEFINSMGPLSEIVIAMFSLFANLEHNKISERVQSGMRRAKEEGSVFGRKKTIDREKVLWYKERYNYSNKFIAHIMGVSGTAIDKIMNNEIDFTTDKKLYCRPR